MLLGCVAPRLSTAYTQTKVKSNVLMNDFVLDSADLCTASTGSKILTRLQEVREQYDKVCLILENDPVRVGTRKPV